LPINSSQLRRHFRSSFLKRRIASSFVKAEAAAVPVNSAKAAFLKKEAFGLSVDRCDSATSLAVSGRFSQGRNQAALKHKGERT